MVKSLNDRKSGGFDEAPLKVSKLVAEFMQSLYPQKSISHNFQVK